MLMFVYHNFNFALYFIFEIQSLACCRVFLNIQYTITV